MEGFTSSVRSRVNFDTPRGPAEGRIDTDTWGPGFSVARFYAAGDPRAVNR